MLKVAPCGIAHGKGQPNGQGERSLSGPIFPTPRAKLACGTPPTAYYRQSAGFADSFALGLSGLPRAHQNQSGIPRPCILSVCVMRALQVSRGVGKIGLLCRPPSPFGPVDRHANLSSLPAQYRLSSKLLDIHDCTRTEACFKISCIRAKLELGTNL